MVAGPEAQRGEGRQALRPRRPQRAGQRADHRRALLVADAEPVVVPQRRLLGLRLRCRGAAAAVAALLAPRRLRDALDLRQSRRRHLLRQELGDLRDAAARVQQLVEIVLPEPFVAKVTENGHSNLIEIVRLTGCLVKFDSFGQDERKGVLKG